jgi:hypothetical protein
MLTEIDPQASDLRDRQARIPAAVPAGESLPLPAREVAAAAGYARAEKAAATRRAYRTDFEIFRAWCTERRISALPASATGLTTPDLASMRRTPAAFS